MSLSSRDAGEDQENEEERCKSRKDRVGCSDCMACDASAFRLAATIGKNQSPTVRCDKVASALGRSEPTDNDPPLRQARRMGQFKWRAGSEPI